MIKSLVYELLTKKRNKEQHELIKLQWEKAKLEKLLEQQKKARSE